MVEPMTKTHYL